MPQAAQNAHEGEEDNRDIRNNTPVFTPEPNEDEVVSCMDIIGKAPARRETNGALQAATGMR